METETCKLYSGVFWIFQPNFIKIDLYNFELYRFKVGAFFRHSVEVSVTFRFRENWKHGTDGWTDWVQHSLLWRAA